MLVPIYDGRTLGNDLAFECDPSQLHELAVGSYPLYDSGVKDLPPGSVVAVAYTAHMFPTTSHYWGVKTSLSLNLISVVLLALPQGSEARSSSFMGSPSGSNTNAVSSHSRFIPHSSPVAPLPQAPGGWQGGFGGARVAGAEEVVYYEDLYRKH